MKAFSITRFSIWLFLLESLSAGMWGAILSRGLWGGYFVSLPIIPLFFTIVGAVSVHFMRKGLLLKSRKAVSQVMIVVVARLLGSLAFVLLGFLLIPDAHFVAFLIVTAFCYLLAFLLMARAALHP